MFEVLFSSRRHALSPVVATFLCLVGCHHSSNSPQVVATVNDRELTLIQLNETLQTNEIDATPDNARKAIHSLIDEELLVQQALKSSLDRDPSVVHTMEHARRTVLADAFLQRMVYPKKQISSQEMEGYYQSNPGLFEKRRVYHLTSFTVRTSDMNDRLTNDLASAHSEETVRTILEKHEVKFTTEQVTAAAEDLPLDRLSAFTNSKAGDLIVIEQKNGFTLLMSVTGADDRPLTFERAKPMIVQYLTTVRNAKALDTYLEGLRQSAKITYAPGFLSQSEGGADHAGNGDKGMATNQSPNKTATGLD